MRTAMLFSVASIFFVVSGEGLRAEDANVFAALPKPVLAFHKEENEHCNYGTANGVSPEMAEAWPSSAYDVGRGWKLYLVPCSLGAYNGFSVVYTATVDSENIRQMPFVAWGRNGPTVTHELVNAEYDPKTRVLSSLFLFRGVGGCGRSAQYEIFANEHGLRPKVIEIRYKADCNGEEGTTFPMVFPTD